MLPAIIRRRWIEPVDVTRADWRTCHTCTGEADSEADRCWLVCALRAMWPATTVMVGLLKVAHIIDIRAA